MLLRAQCNSLACQQNLTTGRHSNTSQAHVSHSLPAATLSSPTRVRISFLPWVGSGSDPAAPTTPDPRSGSENTRTFVFAAGQRTGSELACHYMGPAHHNGRFRGTLKPGITVAVQLAESGVRSGVGLLARCSGSRVQRQVLDAGLHVKIESRVATEMHRAEDAAF